MVLPQVLCVGEILFDRLADQVGLAVDQVQSWADFPGGAPANVACALTKLGTPAGFIGCVGQDREGQSLVDLLGQNGVNAMGVQRHPHAPTRIVYVLRSALGDREFAGFGQGNTGEFADTHLQADQLPIDLFKAADYLVLGTLGLAYPASRQALGRALALAQTHGLQVVMDVNWRPMFWPHPDLATAIIVPYLEQVDWLKLSKEEALLLFHTPDPQAIAAALPQASGILVTDGDQGCTYTLAGQSGYCPAFRVAAIDTTGAGDGFVAGFIHQLCRYGRQALASGQGAAQMIRYASAVGALTTLRAGAIAAQPTALEVQTFLQAHP